jgi:hypothetical protein
VFKPFEKSMFILKMCRYHLILLSVCFPRCLNFRFQSFVSFSTAFFILLQNLISAGISDLDFGLIHPKIVSSLPASAMAKCSHTVGTKKTEKSVLNSNIEEQCV